MRLKSRLIMILILSGLLFVELVGGLKYSAGRKEEIPGEVPSEPVEKSIPASFKGNISEAETLPEGVIQVIVDYMDAYYRSLYTLEKEDVSALFADQRMAAISDRANALVVEVRKMYDFDFTLDKAHYDLKVVDHTREGDTYKIYLLEDDFFNFAFLPGIESSVYDIDCYYQITEKDGTYLISDLEKVQGYYQTFYECEDLDAINETYDYYVSQLSDMLDYYDEVLRPKARQPYLSDQTYRKAYDRSAAVAYADSYYHERNQAWYNFTGEGGNCQNYASQALLAGGIDMDYAGEEQWKCYISDPDYDPYINDEETPSGRSRSWINVPYFYDYAKNNEGSGLVADVGANLFQAEAGDIIIVGNGSLAHTVIVSRVVDGHILVNSNSIDMKDYPLEAYTYTNVVLIKILGSN